MANTNTFISHYFTKVKQFNEDHGDLSAIPTYWAHSMGPQRSPMSRVVVVVVVVMDIDAQAARDSTGSDTW